MYLQTYVRMYIWGMLWNFSKTGVPRFESGVFDNLCLDCDVPEPFGSLWFDWYIWGSVFRMWGLWSQLRVCVARSESEVLEGVCTRCEVSDSLKVFFLELTLAYLEIIFKVIFEVFEVCVLRFQIDAFSGLCLRCQVSEPFEHLCSMFWVSGVRVCAQGISTHKSFRSVV